MANQQPKLLTAEPVKLVTDRPKGLKSNMPPIPAPEYAKNMAEYEKLAKEVGIKAPFAEVEAFRIFLMENEITVFALHEVVKYMDAKAKLEAEKNGGWMWKPLRKQDYIDGSFGQNAKRSDWDNRVTKSASDYYTHGADIYPHTIPLHALRKVSLIEKGFKKGKARFMVSDYAPKPAIRYPDPFLMVVIPNTELRLGTGRFVIDFWEEPGFGLEQQLGISKRTTKKKKA